MKRTDLQARLAEHGLRLHRDRGQNFLVDPGRAAQLVRLAGVRPGDSVVEVGTGLGALTRAAAGIAGRLVTIEIDSGLVRVLEADSLLPEGVELMHADALEVDFPSLLARLPAPRRLVANLPYSVATPLVRRLLDCTDALEDWSVMVQREVADRLVADVGSKAYGALSIVHQLVVDVERLADLPPDAFFPAPRVASAFVRMTPRGDAGLAPGELAVVERVARAAFSQRRKTLWNALRAGGFGGVHEARLARALEETGIDPRLRAEKLAPETMLALARALEPDADTAA